MLNEGSARTEFGQLIDRIKNREGKVASMFMITTLSARPLNQWTLRTRFDDARATAVKAATEADDKDLASRIRAFQFRDIRPKTASELPVEHASKLLGHTQQETTESVYRRLGETVEPTK